MKFEDLAPLAVLVRDGLNESFHHGVAVLLDARQNVLASHGNIAVPIYPRSALKPVQALAMRELGLQLGGVELVLSMASHQGTEDHTAVVEAILASHGLTAGDLMCPRAFPGNPNTRAKHNEMSRVAMNCSGKHAAFLATCTIQGWDTKNYLDAQHPLQWAIRERVEQLSGEKVAKVTSDGCGAPLFALSTLGLAKAMSGFSKLGQDLVTAAKENPWAIGDRGSVDAVFLEHGFMAKIGAEGVFVVTTGAGESVAVKIADGNLRAAPSVALDLLHKHQLVAKSDYDSIWEQVNPKVYGGDSVTGKLLVTI
jgi:L-asparaginase II